MQLAESIDNELVKEVLIDIVDEERIHAGEFLRLLHHLAPDGQKFYDEGYEEVEEEIEKLDKLSFFSMLASIQEVTIYYHIYSHSVRL